jgi:anti-sigma factor RsiW
MKQDKEKLSQAYLDGELSASEISEFERILSAEERDRLAGEIRFERALGERLAHDAECPDAVWRRVEQIHGLRPRFAQRHRRIGWGIASLAAAACIGFFAAVYGPGLVRITPGIEMDSEAVVLAAETVEELQAASMTQPGRDAVQQFLRNAGITLEVDSVEALPMGALHHDIAIIGARKDPAGRDAVYELLFACCGYPVKVVVARCGSHAAETIGRAAAVDGQVQATRRVAGYLAAVVGNHEARDLIDIFAPPSQ